MAERVPVANARALIASALIDARDHDLPNPHGNRLFAIGMLDALDDDGDDDVKAILKRVVTNEAEG